MEHSFNTLVVITPKDCLRLIKLYPRLADSIKYGQITFVGTKEVDEIIKSDAVMSTRSTAILEDSIIPFDEVHKCIADRMKNILDGRDLPRGITGWYYQQFLNKNCLLIYQHLPYLFSFSNLIKTFTYI